MGSVLPCSPLSPISVCWNAAPAFHITAEDPTPVRYLHRRRDLAGTFGRIFAKIKLGRLAGEE